MSWFTSKPKCYFCEQKEGLMYSVHDYGLYGEAGERLYYHPECMEMVEMDPEKFGHVMMDKALKIEELKKQCIRKYNNSIIRKHEDKISRLHKQNFERMMPKKISSGWRPIKPPPPPCPPSRKA
jgi:hypothetical protein